MQKPIKQALVCWFVASSLTLLALRTFHGEPGSTDGAIEAGTRMVAHAGLAAFVVWLLARRKVPSWSWLRFYSTYLVVIVALGLIAAAGRASADEPWPFKAEFPPGWSVERFAGISSAPEDQASGVRERAQWNGADGAAIMEVTCAWIAADSRSDNGAQLEPIMNAMSKALSAQGIVLEKDAIRTIPLTARNWRAADLLAKDSSGIRFRHTIAVASTRRCALSATLTGTPEAFSRQSAAFVTSLDRLRAE